MLLDVFSNSATPPMVMTAAASLAIFLTPLLSISILPLSNVKVPVLSMPTLVTFSMSVIARLKNVPEFCIALIPASLMFIISPLAPSQPPALTIAFLDIPDVKFNVPPAL